MGHAACVGIAPFTHARVSSPLPKREGKSPASFPPAASLSLSLSLAPEHAFLDRGQCGDQRVRAAACGRLKVQL